VVSKSLVQAPRKGDNQEASDGEQDLTQRIHHHRERIELEQDAGMRSPERQVLAGDASRAIYQIGRYRVKHATLQMQDLRIRSYTS
jgi:hypothetical protein